MYALRGLWFEGTYLILIHQRSERNLHPSPCNAYTLFQSCGRGAQSFGMWYQSIQSILCQGKLCDGLRCAQGDAKHHMVRFSCNQGYEAWNFWLEVDVTQPEVSLHVAVSLLEQTDAIKDFTSRLPSWTSEVAVTTYQSSWDL